MNAKNILIRFNRNPVATTDEFLSEDNGVTVIGYFDVDKNLVAMRLTGTLEIEIEVNSENDPT